MPEMKSNLAPNTQGPDVLSGYKTVREAAQVLKVSERRVIDFLRPASKGQAPRLAALRFGRVWLIPIHALMDFRRKPRLVGRPPTKVA
jgi:hypothetical protein